MGGSSSSLRRILYRCFFAMKICVLVLAFVTCAVGHYYDPQHSGQDHDFKSVEVTPSKGLPWPLPQQYIKDPTYFTITPRSFKFVYDQKCDVVASAISRCQKYAFLDRCVRSAKAKWNIKNMLFKSRPLNVRTLNNLTIKITGPCEKWPYMNMDEQYLIKINAPDMPNEALLYSTTVWGAIRGLETFAQLVYSPSPNEFVINTTTILDFPRFSHRGLLLDTSRHFVPVPVLLQNLDAMAQVKLNVFHWHIVDDQSFPYVSKTFPDLSNKGAFDPATHVYTQDDVAHIIEYARLRGIRVLAEFDSPGHTQSWGKSQKDLLTPCYSSGVPNGNFGPIDPTVPENYKFLNSFFGEVSRVFPDSYLHLGGDEVSFDCWKTNPNVTDFMKQHGFASDYSKLEGYYVQQLLDIIKSLNKSYIVWQEVFDNQVKVKLDTVIHVWKDPYPSELFNVTSAGYNTILSTCWYLNYISYGSDWVQYYACDPHNFNGTQDQKRLVIGGEACMWGEYVDGFNFMTRTWPRTAAVAERLWSNQTVTNVNDAMPRLEQLRCTMIKRGLNVEPAIGPGFCECDYLAQ